MNSISLVPEYVIGIGRAMLSNTFTTSIVASVILILFALLLAFRMRRTPNSPLVRLTQAGMTEVLWFVDSITQNRDLSKQVFPLIATFFIYIITNNIMALLPGFGGSIWVSAAGKAVPLFRSANSDLTATFALAFCSVAATQWISLSVLGVRGYVRRFIDLSGPLRFIMGIFEILSELVRVLSFSFRLFGNILAGEILLLIIAQLFPLLLPVPFMLLEVFVGVLQGFIFASLTVAFMKTGSMRLLEKTV